MSDGSLSQDEIDALLSGSGGMDFESTAEPAGGDVDISGLQSVLNETIDAQASNLSSLTSASVSIDPPTVQVTDKESFLSMLSDEVVVVAMDYNEGVAADHGYVVSTDGAVSIAAAMMGLDGVEIDDASINALQEALSNLSGPVTTAVGDKVDETIMTVAPEGQQSPKAMITLPSGKFVAVTYTVNMDGSTIQLYEYFGLAVARALAPAPAAGNGLDDLMQNGGAQQGMQQPQMQQMGQMGQMQQGYPQQQMGGYQQPMQQGGLNVQSVQFPGLQQGPAQQEQGNISLLMDVYMEMTVELGRTRKLIREILGMGEGTIIELDKLAGEPVDILVNHKLIAKGEVVVIDENFGVRVTEIVSPLERMNNMT
ncbi:flagellar motor switch protein FliN [Spirochaeta africana]|uniref:Flagellar motor switch protein FliN n=1 Tax=Spirochaeta africana (strain ATCC 700263 / DSM 8902 / Z-7692) TaxID=889378 RepID=H9UKU6_SPIAZ|nr:flagellar motor switch protein FliN [Spirochaeta africana]AFG38139.1 flagellar motor switch protein FliN [Spirochaeta africana DSM 8902]